MSSAFVAAVVVLLVTAMATIVVGAIAAKRLSERIGQIFEGHIRPKLFPAKHLDLLALQRRMVVAALTGVTVSVSGERYLAKELSLQVSPRDHWRLANDIDGGLARVGADLATEIGRRAIKLGHTVPPEMAVVILVSAFVVDGRPVQAAAAVTTAERTTPTPTLSRPAAVKALPASANPGLSIQGTRLAATRRWQDANKSDVQATVNIDEAILIPDSGGTAIKLAGRRTTIGRKEPGHGRDVAIDHPTVSSSHAAVSCDRGIWNLADGRSTNGTYVNDVQIKNQELVDGDRVQFSSDGPTFVFRLRATASMGSIEPATRRSM